MKKLLLLILHLLVGINLNAQENTFGIRTGIGRSTLKTDYAGSDSDFVSKGKLSFHLAVFAEHKLSNHLALQGEISISTTGGRNNFYDDDSSKNTNAITLGKLSIPLMLTYYCIQRFSINGGIIPSFILETMSEDRNNEKFFSTLLGDSINIKNDVKVFELNPFLGVEFHISRKIFLDARYIFGIYDIAKNNKDSGFDSLKNSYLQVGVGFKIKK